MNAVGWGGDLPVVVVAAVSAVVLFSSSYRPVMAMAMVGWLGRRSAKKPSPVARPMRMVLTGTFSILSEALFTCWCVADVSC